jgi:O-antigen/teichoic acid export membrane protein
MMLAPSQQRSIFRRWLARTPIAGLLSLRYMTLRAWTAGGGILAGLVQTFVFARVLDPETFSLFILVGALGVSMWLFDLGFSRIVFVRMRECFLAGQDTSAVGAQATAIALFYAVLIAIVAALCIVVLALRPEIDLLTAIELGLFFFFSAFNLTWFVLRNASLAVDDYIHYEALESCRRIVHIALMLALLAGLPFFVFIVLINAGWAVLIGLAGARLIKRGALNSQFGGLLSRLREFFRDNRDAALRTGIHASGEVYIHGILYLAVPIAFGLGSPTIVVDTALKIFLGTLNLCTAACDLLVPRQTVAYAKRDRHTLIRATLVAVALCAAPALAVAGILMIDAERLFALLLGDAAIVPASVTPILLVLLAAGVIKTAPAFLLAYTGYFKEVAWLSVINVVLMTAAMIAGFVLRVDMVGLLAIYAGVFVVASALYAGTAWRGPIGAAH